MGISRITEKKVEFLRKCTHNLYDSGTEFHFIMTYTPVCLMCPILGYLFEKRKKVDCENGIKEQEKAHILYSPIKNNKVNK